MADLTRQDFVEQATDYLEDALDQAARSRFGEHMAICAGCGTFLNRMKDMASRLGEIPDETLSDEMRSTLMSAFRDFRR